MILALDLATVTGWCVGTIGAPPSWGSHNFGRGRGNGQVLSDYLTWLNGKIDETQAQVVAFESPYMPTGGLNNPWTAPANALTIRRLYCFAGFTEAVCHIRRVRCYEARPSEITRSFLGGPAPKRRLEKKAATVRMAHLMGFQVVDDDEADALALWLYAEAQFAPAMISRRRADVGLELDLHAPEKKGAPRRYPRSARTITAGRAENGRKQTNNSASRQLQLSTTPNC